MKVGQIVSMRKYNGEAEGILKFTRPYTNEPRTSGYVLKTQFGVRTAPTKKALMKMRGK